MDSQAISAEFPFESHYIEVHLMRQNNEADETLQAIIGGRSGE